MNGGRPVDPEAVLGRVRGLLGPEGGTVEGGTAVARPVSDEQVSALLNVAGEQGWRVLPAGAGVGGGLLPTRGAGVGTTPATKPDLVISTLGMAGVLEHEPADLTFRARSGTTLGELQPVVGAARQWLALDPPGGGRVTLGGVVATGAAGPARVLYGRPRDQLLGLTMIDGAGRTLSLGGRVVKNVAGFDLVRLATGSRGTLGVITEVTFRLYPLPEEDRTLIWSRETLEEGWKLGRRLATHPLPLAAAEMIGGSWGTPIDDTGYRVLLRLTGSTAAVTRMREILLEAAGLPLREFAGEESLSVWATLAEADGPGGTTFRAHALPDRGKALLPAMAKLPLDRLALHLLQGSFRGSLSAGSALEVLAPLTEPVRAAGGTLRLLRVAGALPSEGFAGIEVGTDAGPAAGGLPARIAAGFDPGGILPGSWREGWA